MPFVLKEIVYMEYCGKVVSSRSKYAPPGGHRCYRQVAHEGNCHETPYLAHLSSVEPSVARKIGRDAVMTTGAAWASEDAGPNRIRRWVMLYSDDELRGLGIHMADLKPGIQAKLRDKAATYEDCMRVAQKLTALVYGMPNAPTPPDDIRAYLQVVTGDPITENSTTCLVCLDLLDFRLFKEARRGRAEIETAHRNPRKHTLENVGFAHRPCNIAQGDKTLEDFYAWIASILAKVKAAGSSRPLK